MTAPQSLPERMRLAADILDDVNTYIEDVTPNAHWRPNELRAEADQVEAEEREKAERASQAERLGRDVATAIFRAQYDSLDDDDRRRCDEVAADLIQADWRNDGAA